MAQKLLYELFAILNVDATLYSVHYATTAEVVDGRVVSLVSNSVFDASCNTAKVEVQCVGSSDSQCKVCLVSVYLVVSCVELAELNCFTVLSQDVSVGIFYSSSSECAAKASFYL